MWGWCKLKLPYPNQTCHNMEATCELHELYANQSAFNANDRLYYLG